MSSLPRSTPAEQEVDATGIDAFVEGVAALPAAELHSLMVVRHGQVVAERWWHPYGPQHPRVLYSLSKSFTATALGFAVDEGLVDLDAPVLSYFPEWDELVTDPRSRATLVRHVAAMASGHAGEREDEAREAGDGDPALGLLRVVPEFEPDTRFAYNQACTNTVGAIVRKVGKRSLGEYLRPRLFEPLGIDPRGWWHDAAGRELDHLALHTTTEAIAALGQVYLDGGVWRGSRLLSPEWVAEATRVQVATEDPGLDWQQGYGLQIWMSRYGYRLAGAYGQFTVVLPEADAVVAITSQSPDMQGLLDQVWTHLLPALTAGTGPRGQWPARVPHLTRPAGAHPALASATYRPGPGNTLARLTEVTLTCDAITLVDDGPAVTAAVGPDGGWTTTDVFATAWAATPGGLAVDMIALETPHRLRLTLDTADRTFVATWQTTPLTDRPLAQLRMPHTANPPSDALIPVLAWYEAIIAGDADTMRALLDPEMEYIIATGFPAGGRYLGPDSIFEDFFPRSAPTWRTIAPTIDEIVAVTSERVVVRGRYVGRTKETDTPFDVPYAHLWRVRDGKLASLRQYIDTALIQDAIAGRTRPVPPR